MDGKAAVDGVHGIGQALHEHTVYNESDQFLSAGFMDYAMLRADGWPLSIWAAIEAAR